MSAMNVYTVYDPGTGTNRRALALKLASLLMRGSGPHAMVRSAVPPKLAR